MGGLNVYALSKIEKVILLYFPSVSAVEQFVYRVYLAVALYVCHLTAYFVIVSYILHVADDTEGYREIRTFHIDEHPVYARIRVVCVVYENIVFRNSVFADCDHFELETVKTQTLVVVLAEYHTLAVTENDGLLLAKFFGCREFCESLVVEYHAVLKNLDN